MELLDLLKSPVLLAPNNFTDLNRTPWAGASIGQTYKKDLVAGAAGLRIGEAWEFSCDPDFPSQVAGQPQVSLANLVERYPDEVLSPAWRQTQSAPHCEILVKLLNAASPLSLQVHPEDDDPNLAPGECGKPESWLILAAEAGAGIYLGFAQALTKQELAAALAAGADLRPYLNFVPVAENDFFDIAPGVPHAIGAGVTLLEPQRIRQGHSGKTYRLWDWNRTYDARGGLDPVAGTPRALHIDASLRIIDPLHQVGAQFVASLKQTPKKSSPRPGASLLTFPANAYYQVERLHLQEGANVDLRLNAGYGALMVLGGDLTITSAHGRPCQLRTGQPALLPFIAAPLHFMAKQSCDIVVVTPSQSGSFWL